MAKTMTAQALSYDGACALLEKELYTSSRIYASELTDLTGNCDILDIGIIPSTLYLQQIKMLHHIETKATSDACGSLILPPNQSIPLLRAIRGASRYTERTEALIAKVKGASSVATSSLLLSEKLEWYIAAQQGAIHMCNQAVTERGHLERKILYLRRWMAFEMMPGEDIPNPTWYQSTPALGIRFVDGEPVTRHLPQAPEISLEYAMNEIPLTPGNILPELLAQHGLLPPVFSGLPVLRTMLEEFVAPGKRLDHFERVLNMHPTTDGVDERQAINQAAKELSAIMPDVVGYEKRYLQTAEQLFLQANPSHEALFRAHNQRIVHLTGESGGVDVMSTSAVLFMLLIWVSATFVSPRLTSSKHRMYLSVTLEHLGRMLLVWHKITNDAESIDHTAYMSCMVAGMILIHEFTLLLPPSNWMMGTGIAVAAASYRLYELGMVSEPGSLPLNADYLGSSLEGGDLPIIPPEFFSEEAILQQMTVQAGCFVSVAVLTYTHRMFREGNRLYHAPDKNHELISLAWRAMGNAASVFTGDRQSLAPQGTGSPSIMTLLANLAKGHPTPIAWSTVDVLQSIVTATVTVCVPVFLLGVADSSGMSGIYSVGCGLSVIYSFGNTISNMERNPTLSWQRMLLVPLGVARQSRRVSATPAIFVNVVTVNIASTMVASAIEYFPFFMHPGDTLIDVFSTPSNLVDILEDPSPQRYRDILETLNTISKRKRTNSIGLTASGAVIANTEEATDALRQNLVVEAKNSVRRAWNINIRFADLQRAETNPDSVFFQFDRLQWHRAMLYLFDTRLVNPGNIDRLQIRRELELEVNTPFDVSETGILFPPRLQEQTMKEFEVLIASYMTLQIDDVFFNPSTRFDIHDHKKQQIQLMRLYRHKYPATSTGQKMALSVMAFSTMGVFPSITAAPKELEELTPLVLGFPLECLRLLDVGINESILRSFLQEAWDKGNYLIEYYLDANMVEHLRTELVHLKPEIETMAARFKQTTTMSRMAPLLMRYAILLKQHIDVKRDARETVHTAIWNQYFALVGVFLTVASGAFENEDRTDILKTSHPDLQKLLFSMMAYRGKDFPTTELFDDPDKRFQTILAAFNTWMKERDGSTGRSQPVSRTGVPSNMNDPTAANQQVQQRQASSSLVNLPRVKLNRSTPAVDMLFMRNMGEKSKLLAKPTDRKGTVGHETLFWMEARGKTSLTTNPTVSDSPKLVSLFIRPVRDSLTTSERQAAERSIRDFIGSISL